MQLNAVSIPIPHANASSHTRSSAGAQSSNPVQETNSMFMKLLTAQLQNQSPLDPVDPMQFTSQLVQFNMLDQLTQINSVLQQSLSNPAANGAAAVSGGH